MNEEKRAVLMPGSNLVLSERYHNVHINCLFLCMLWKSFTVTAGQSCAECSDNKRSGCATK